MRSALIARLRLLQDTEREVIEAGSEPYSERVLILRKRVEDKTRAEFIL